MRNPRLKIIILLTALVGFVVPAVAQVDTIPDPSSPDSFLLRPDPLPGVFPPDSLPADSTEEDGKVRLSTDSVYATPVNNDGLLSSDVEYTASDSIVGSPLYGYAELYNEAYVKYEGLTLTAGYIRMDFNKNEIYAYGIEDSLGNISQKPVFSENGKSYRADTMRYNFDTKKAKIKRVITSEGDGFLHGEEVKKEDENTFYIRNASYTTCSHEHPHFRINSPKAKVIAGEKVVTQFAYLEVVDVPTPLMLPFGFFPTSEKRKSGIIIPSYGNNQYRGYFLSNGGYYWAASEYFDLTLTGDAYTQGGYAVRASTSYRKRYRYNGNLNINYSRIKFGREEFADYVGQAFNDSRDFNVTWNHNQDPKANPNFRFGGSVNIGSATYYQRNSIAPNDVLNNTLNSSITASKSWAGKPFNLNMSARHSQNNSSRSLTVTLPQVNFSVNRQFPFRRKEAVGKKKWFEEIGYSYTFDGRNEISTQLGKPFFTESVFTDSARAGISHTIPISANYKVFKFFVLSPNLTYRDRWYFKRKNYYFSDSLNRVLSEDEEGFFINPDFTASANLSTKLYGLWRYKGALKAVRHVMTPTVGLSYKPDFSVLKWGYFQEVQSDTLGNRDRYDRYSEGIYGSASAGKQGNINFGLQNTLEIKVRDRTDSTGVKKIKLLERLSLTGGYNMAVQEFNWQPVNLTASSTAFKGLINLNYSAGFDLYGYDPEGGVNGAGARVPEYAYEVNGKWLRPTSQRFTTGISLSPDRFRSGEKSEEALAEAEEDEKEGLLDDQPKPGSNNSLGISEGDPDYYNMEGFVDFSTTWNMNINYNISKSYNGLEATVRQSMDFSGDIKLTENWRVGFRSGFDFEAKDFTYTTLDFYRDLHCWELRCTWVPFGFQQSYVLTIRVKSSVLQDLKIERRRGVGDFNNF